MLGAYCRSALLRLKGIESPENHPEMQIAIQPVSSRAESLSSQGCGPSRSALHSVCIG